MLPEVLNHLLTLKDLAERCWRSAVSRLTNSCLNFLSSLKSAPPFFCCHWFSFQQNSCHLHVFRRFSVLLKDASNPAAATQATLCSNNPHWPNSRHASVKIIHPIEGLEAEYNYNPPLVSNTVIKPKSPFLQGHRNSFVGVAYCHHFTDTTGKLLRHLYKASGPPFFKGNDVEQKPFVHWEPDKDAAMKAINPAASGSSRAGRVFGLYWMKLAENTNRL